MAEHHRLLQPDRAEAAVPEVMQVGAADAAHRDIDAHLARADLAGVLLFEPQVVRPVDHDTHATHTHDHPPQTTGVSSGAPAKCAARLSRTSQPIA